MWLFTSFPFLTFPILPLFFLVIPPFSMADVGVSGFFEDLPLFPLAHAESLDGQPVLFFMDFVDPHSALHTKHHL